MMLRFLVRRENEGGETIDSFEAISALMARAVASGPSKQSLLSQVDEYGKTTFNGKQIRLLLTEIEILQQENGPKEEFMHKLKQMCDACKDDDGTFIVFYGE